MRGIRVEGAVPHRSSASGSEPAQASPSTGMWKGPQAPPELASRAPHEHGSGLRTRARPPALPTPGAAASPSRHGGPASPGVHTSPPWHDDAPEVRQRLQTQVKTHAGEVEWLTSFQQLVMAQADRVEQRWNLARQELATRHDATEIQPVDHETAQASGLAAQRQAGEHVSLLAWRHRNFGERQEQVAQMLAAAQAQLAKAQQRLGVAAPPPAPTLTPYETPWTSMPGSPASPVVPHTRAESTGSFATMAGQPVEPRQDHMARLQRQADMLGRTIETLQSRLEAAQDEEWEINTLLAAAKAQFENSERQIGHALWERARGGHAPLDDKENSRAYLKMIELEKHVKQLGRSQEALHALLAPAQQDLQKIRQQIVDTDTDTDADTGASPSPSASLRSLSSTPSARQAAADIELLYNALPDGGSAVARLAERAERRSPRTLVGWLRRPSFKGAPKPLEGKRQAAFLRRVRDDVAQVARQGGIPLEQAAELMFEAVDCEALGATLSQADRQHLLHTLDGLRKEAAPAREP